MSGLRKRVYELLVRILPEQGTYVGTDKFGNRFFARKEINPFGDEIERRYLKPPNQGFFQGANPEEFNLENVSVEWSSWMGHTRKTPPSAEESARLDMQRQIMKQKVAELAAEEARAKVRRRALGAQEASNPDMALLQTQLGEGDARASAPAAGGGAKFQPEAWIPARVQHKTSADSSSEPVGTGDTFKPGTWSPGTKP
mmetsp:Transcript_31499/g.60729  ORF Transcript_31499/g.60729 Transcript_31499/m.60729 type:complete len:199 (+) Transcript_31499:309-905(+)|eukprot:CAMPEP_0114247488 /NCGR_PEP_ID=MMETSP0058-20121206/13050_1 /TAXON_ID=36894 /ORGANISM="Pyramimonas parkeae, CCMP726" /LENGTH=198 /DNA_ID=CAMNT_0001360799 /DNA_START=371 /DNA_END=967 /DNA_ORIENTATION=-